MLGAVLFGKSKNTFCAEPDGIYAYRKFKNGAL